MNSIFKLGIGAAIQAFLVFWIFVGLGYGSDVSDAFLHVIQLPEKEYVIFVEKSTQTFFVYSQENGKWVEHMKTACSTGEVDGVKNKAGDKKTPEGVYFPTNEYEDKYLTPVYGKRAFPIDYPNFLDTQKGKNGSSIWIHGTNKVLKPMDSNGCIALENDNVVKLSDFITLNDTPVIIVDRFEHNDQAVKASELKKRINDLVNKWTNAMADGTYHEYLSFYSSAYLPSIDFWRQWQKIKSRFEKSHQSYTIENQRVGIYAHDHIYTVLFEQRFNTEGQSFSLGKRKLYLTAEPGGLKIIGDVKQTIPEKIEKDQEPLIAVAQKILHPHNEKDRVMAMVEQWLKAWSSKDMDVYAALYANDFYSDGMNKTAWVKRKRIIAKQYSYINVKGSDFKFIKLADDQCDIRFFQVYESSGFTAKGMKRLKLIKKGGSWKIFRESWKKK